MTSELEALYCKNGSRHEVYKAECMDFYGIKKFDLNLKDGTITLNSDDTIQRSAELKFLIDDRIDFLNDKVKVSMGVYINGSIKWYPLGVYLFVNPRELNGICECTCYDQTYYIQQDRDITPKLFIKGTNYIDVLKYFIISCGVTKINIPSTTLTLNTDLICDHSKNKLEWFNYVAEQINYTKLSTDAEGWFVSRKYVEPSPVNVSHVYKSNEFSVISGNIGINMDYYNIPNVFTRIVSSPNTQEMKSTYINNDTLSKFSVIRRNGKKITDVKTIDNIANQEELDNLVRKLAFNSVQVEQEIAFETLNMPNHSTNDIIDLRSDSVNGIFIEKSYSMQLKSGSKMNHTCKRLVRLE